MMKKFLVLHGEGPMHIDHHLTNIFQKYLINKIRVEFFVYEISLKNICQVMIYGHRPLPMQN